jgi:hypothetical protein
MTQDWFAAAVHAQPAGAITVMSRFETSLYAMTGLEVGLTAMVH